jgi:DNA modification methylase
MTQESYTTPCGNATLYLGGCEDILPTIPDSSIDSIVTDPPAGIAFMGKDWDKDRGGRDHWIAWMEGIARECLRCLKPGGHALVWALPRTSHWTARAWEDAGFELRDVVAHVNGGSFPKSHNISKAIDREAGAVREVVGVIPDRWTGKGNALNFSTDRPQSEVSVLGGAATDAARQWEGWGTALKPSREDWLLLRKPLARGKTVAGNVLEHGVGGLNVDGCRVGGAGPSGLKPYTRNTTPEVYALGMAKAGREVTYTDHPSGRFPSNLIHDGSDEVVGLFPVTGRSGGGITGKLGYHGADGSNPGISAGGFGDTGSAARFFKACPDDDPEDIDARGLIYCAKASKRDRDEGCEGFEAIHRSNGNKWTDQDYRVARGERPPSAESGPRRNHHPTVKPTSLMRYLCRLITPPGGTILDPFTGSGSTGKAAMLEGFRIIGIEQDPDFHAIASARIAHAGGQRAGELGL